MILVKIGIDVGYSQVKAIAENGRRVLFPSVKALLTADPTAGAFKQGIGHKVKIRTLEREEQALVGEAAMGSFTALTTLNRKKIAELHDFFILTAAYLSGANGQVKLGVGLPLAYYRFQKDELRNRLEKISAHVSVDGGPERYISFSRINVFPQGSGIIAGASLPPNGYVAAVDIGYYTTDYLMFQIIEGDPVPVAEMCGSIDIGVHLVARSIARAYQEKSGAIPPKFLLKQLLDNTSVYFEGREMDLKKEFETACENAGRQITQEVLAAWSKQADNISRITLAGGGALLLNSSLSFNGKTTHPDPVYGNAMGFLGMIA